MKLIRLNPLWPKTTSKARPRWGLFGSGMQSRRRRDAKTQRREEQKRRDTGGMPVVRVGNHGRDARATIEQIHKTPPSIPPGVLRERPHFLPLGATEIENCEGKWRKKIWNCSGAQQQRATEGGGQCPPYYV